MALLVDALASHRLVTLVGPGGVGKTSVGLELAHATAANYADGVHVIELVSVVDDEATSAAFATAIEVNVRRSSSIDDAITEMLRPRQCLLLLDNCEHLIESVAALVSRILSEAPHVSIVATSREPLAVAGEQVWSVEPLSTAIDNSAPGRRGPRGSRRCAVRRTACAPPTRTSCSTTPTCPSSSRSAAASTGSRSRSSSRRRGRACSACPKSRTASTSASRC